MYHGASSREWTNLVNELIRRRNQDAHGSKVYDNDKLEEELDERESMLKKLFEMISFYNNSTLLVPISVELIDQKMQRQVRVFEGLEETTRVTHTMPDYQSPYMPILHSGINDEFDKNMDPAKANILSLFPMILVQL